MNLMAVSLTWKRNLRRIKSVNINTNTYMTHGGSIHHVSTNLKNNIGVCKMMRKLSAVSRIFM